MTCPSPTCVSPIARPGYEDVKQLTATTGPECLVIMMSSLRRIAHLMIQYEKCGVDRSPPVSSRGKLECRNFEAAA